MVFTFFYVFSYRFFVFFLVCHSFFSVLGVVYGYLCCEGPVFSFVGDFLLQCLLFYFVWRSLGCCFVSFHATGFVCAWYRW